MSTTEFEAAKPEAAGFTVFIDTKPKIFWDIAGSSTQVHFLKSIDPTHFDYLASVHLGQIEGPFAVQAAVALRMTYSHAIECLFAVLGAALQGPACPAGWILKYQIHDLRSLASRISNNEEFDNPWGLEFTGWREVADLVLPWSINGQECDDLRAQSALIWNSFASDLLDDAFESEYNSLKHGLRVESGPWSMSIGLERVHGEPPPSSEMRTVAASMHGSTFYQAKALAKYQYGFEMVRLNWEPVALAKRIALAVGSIQNILSFLKDLYGVPWEELVFYEIEGELFQDAVRHVNKATQSRLQKHCPIDGKKLLPVTPEELRTLYLAERDTAQGN